MDNSENAMAATFVLLKDSSDKKEVLKSLLIQYISEQVPINVDSAVYTLDMCLESAKTKEDRALLKAVVGEVLNQLKKDSELMKSLTTKSLKWRLDKNINAFDKCINEDLFPKWID